MAAQKSFNQLDPFEEKERFKTKEIRHSSSRISHNPFANSQKKGANAKTNLTLIYVGLVLVIICAAITLIFILKSAGQKSDPTISDNPLVNPAGRDASSEYTKDTNDPEIHTRELNKLNTMLDLIADEQWEYANATFETIFPDYLDICERYDYYRSAVTLADNFENFTVSRETAETRMNYLLEKCGSSEAE